MLFQRLVLASQSPRRRELLNPLVKDLIIRPADIDETQKKNESPKAYVNRLSLEKWRAVADSVLKPELILAAYTTVVLRGKIFGKARDENEARTMLKALSNKTHQVLTAMTIGKSKSRPKTYLVSTDVSFRKLSNEDLDWYLQTHEWKDKAGSYAIQGLSVAFVSKIKGSLTNVIGLPVEELFH